MSGSRTDWQWWHDPENHEAILLQPNGGGGLAIYESELGEIVFRQSDFYEDCDACIAVSPHLARAVVARLIELCPGLVEPVKPLPATLLLAPPRRQSGTGLGRGQGDLLAQAAE